MRRLPGILCSIVFLIPLSVFASDDGFEALFNGHDLAGWMMGPDQSWIVQDGVIALKRQFDGKEHNLDYLWTERDYGDFILELECKFPERANSGIFLRTPDLNDPVYTGIEVQVANSYGRQEWNSRNCAGAIYDCVVPSKNAAQEAGQWNRYRITCRGSRITVVLNGEQVVDADLNRWTESNKNPDGTPNKFGTALKDFARVGRIGLQDHGRPVWYRNIRVKRLDAVASIAGLRQDSQASYSLVPDEYGHVLKTADGRTVFRYMTKKPAVTNLTANSVCCFYPVKTPLGEDVVEFATPDHRHHRGIFLAWHSTEAGQRADFWGWGAHAPTEGRVIKNRKVELTDSDGKKAVMRIQNDWCIGDEVVMHETLAANVREERRVFVVDLDYRFDPTRRVTLNHTAFGGFCIKGRSDGTAVYSDPNGPVKNMPVPFHATPENNWPSADWYDYSVTGPNGKTAGIAVLDHPDNPATTWHNLGQIHMVNPCIVAGGPVTIEPDRPLRLRYRLVIHDGPAPTTTLESLRDAWRQ